jgi:hypothetical protein
MKEQQNFVIIKKKHVKVTSTKIKICNSAEGN